MRCKKFIYSRDTVLGCYGTSWCDLDLTFELAEVTLSTFCLGYISEAARSLRCRKLKQILIGDVSMQCRSVTLI